MPDPLHIVLVMIEPPLPFGNAAGRWFYVLLKGLVERGHHVRAFATCRQAEDINEARRLFPAPTYDLRLYPHPKRSGLRAKWESFRQPYSYVFSAELRRDLDRELNRGFDVLHLEQLWSGWLGLNHTDRALLDLHYLYQIDLAEVRPRSWQDHARRWCTLRAERHLIRHYPVLLCVTPRLSDRVREINPNSQVHTVPHVIDLTLYSFTNSRPTDRDPVVGLIGSFNWYPSYLAAERLLTRLWPEIKRRVPKARLQIVGRDARSALGGFLGRRDVVIYENVPDIIPYFCSTDVLLYAPTEGSGIKIKVLEAFALGVSVVCNKNGVEGIPALDGVHAGICEDDLGLVERTVALLNDRKSRECHQLAARELVESCCSPRASLDQLESLYRAMVCTC